MKGPEIKALAKAPQRGAKVVDIMTGIKRVAKPNAAADAAAKKKAGQCVGLLDYPFMKRLFSSNKPGCGCYAQYAYRLAPISILPEQLRKV